MENNILFLDTETTGLPLNYTLDYSKIDNWPRMVQIAWLLYDRQGNLLDSRSFIIKPEDFDITQNAIDIHKIDNQKALTEGHDLMKILFKFIEALKTCNLLIGHNIKFDEKVVGCELYRKHFDTTKLATIDKLCTMTNDNIINYCGLRGKRPTLNELYIALYGEELKNKHDALSDVEATANCYFELMRRNIISSKNNIVPKKICTTSEKITDNNINKQSNKNLNSLLIIPLVNKLTQKSVFRNEQAIIMNKANEYFDTDEDDYPYDDDHENYMTEMMNDYMYLEALEQEEFKNNTLLKSQVDEQSSDWKKRFNEVTIFNDNISIGRQVDNFYFIESESGEILTNDKYELISVVNPNIVVVKQKGKIGIKDGALLELLQLEFSQIINYDDSFFVTLRFDNSVRSNNSRYKLYHINQLDILGIEYQDMSYFNYGLFKVQNIGYSLKYGLINVRGDILVKYEWNEFYNLSNKIPMYFAARSTSVITIFKFREEYNNVEEISKLYADEISFKSTDAKGRIVLQIEKYNMVGLIDLFGNTLTQKIYYNIELLEIEKLIKVCIKTERSNTILYGLLNQNYEEILPCEFTKIEPFQNGLSIVHKKEQVQVINLEGLFISEEKFNFACYVTNGDIAFVQSNIKVIEKGFIFKDKMTINLFTLGILNNEGIVTSQYKWNKIHLRAFFEENNSQDMLIYVLTSLKKSVNKYVSFDQYCNSYTIFSEQELKLWFNVNFREIDQHIVDIKSGKFHEVKTKLF